MLLVIDGMNGAGKTSVGEYIDSAEEDLVSGAAKFVQIKHFPLSYTSSVTSQFDITLPHALYNYGSIMQKMAYTEAMRDLLDIGNTTFDSTLFVFDRWTPSGIVYPVIDNALANVGNMRNSYKNQVKLHEDVLEADLTIILISDPKVCYDRIEKRNRQDDAKVAYPNKYMSLENLDRAYFWFSHAITDIPRSILIDTTSIDVFTLRNSLYNAVKYARKDDISWSVLEYLLSSDIHPFIKVANVS